LKTNRLSPPVHPDPSIRLTATPSLRVKLRRAQQGDRKKGSLSGDVSAIAFGDGWSEDGSEASRMSKKKGES